MFGLTPQVIAAIQAVFAKYPQVERVVLYGSRALGTYRKGSDIDLTMAGSELDLSLQQKIEVELDDLLLPYKIDLSIVHHIKNPDLASHIAQAGVTFYERG